MNIVTTQPGSLGHPYRKALDDLRLERGFARIADSDLRHGNAVALLRDSRENYPAWLEAIRSAQTVVHFENFIIADDDTGRQFAEALMERARAGVRVRVLYDWLGSSMRALPHYWRRLREAGVEARVFNPPRLTDPFWVRRNHRKLITVDGRIAFVSGLCISDSWVGKNGTEPWRDTGLSLQGPVVADLDATFAESWVLAGMKAIPKSELPNADLIPHAGSVPARVISGEPGMFRTYRVDQFIAATAQRNLWLTDAYFVATTSYVQALGEAARDGVDVRILVPGSSDVPALQPVVRAGYRSLIEAGIRVYEWNGSMLHAKTAVADGRWARVGSTNLNIASWATNWELDVVVEDTGFAEAMEAMYLEDLANATEIVPGWQSRRRQARNMRSRRGHRFAKGGVRRLAAGALALSSTVGKAVGSRSLTATEASSIAIIGFAVLALAALITFFPVLIVSPIVIALAWLGIALLIRAFRLKRRVRLRRRKLALRRRLTKIKESEASPGE
ncbi:MAG: phospholipase D-like domain-containing protein [Microvirga sp.]|jgi:cardiolipin synthase|uniref:Phospholipase D n=1 Tax=Microvirga tunisiensis TaxID=2108360 RepID=A0A5N7MFZ1_9HYPH|nr:phospholipase D-like domain-containing protein [Microvirga tunisiensis]MPR07832.1 cardiolipin synthase B [Microvirga tunisiensis]MPR25797.1 cardiolipin synthase B [Microvirga tunisiensis]